MSTGEGWSRNFVFEIRQRMNHRGNGLIPLKMSPDLSQCRGFNNVRSGMGRVMRPGNNPVDIGVSAWEFRGKF